MTALLVGAVSNESVNKNKSVSPSIPILIPTPTPTPTSIPAPVQIPGHGLIADHLDLPTKFGDEDDVIESKAAAEKKASENAGIGSSASRNDDDDEHYDDDDDFLSGHNADKNPNGSHHHDTDESEADYDDESDLGPTLDNFGTKLDGSDAGNELPIFLMEPQSAYAVRNRPAVLKCKAAHALQVCHYHFLSLISTEIYSRISTHFLSNFSPAFKSRIETCNFCQTHSSNTQSHTYSRFYLIAF